MAIGPIELLVVKFPEDRFTGRIAAALEKLVSTGTIRIIDIIFVAKGEDSEIAMFEINDLDDDDYATFDPVIADVTGMLSQEDIRELSGLLEPNSYAALMLFENTWATEFRDALLAAKGELVLSERIPKWVIDQVLSPQYQEQQAA